MKKGLVLVLGLLLVVVMGESVNAKVHLFYSTPVFGSKLINPTVEPDNLTLDYPINMTNFGVPSNDLLIEGNFDYIIEELNASDSQLQTGFISLRLREANHLKRHFHLGDQEYLYDRTLFAKDNHINLGLRIIDHTGIEYIGYATGIRESGVDSGADFALLYVVSFEAYSVNNENRISGNLLLEVSADINTKKIIKDNIDIEIQGFIDGSQNRISALESWQQTIDDWKDTIADTITNILSTITGHTTTLDDHEVRIDTIENSCCETEETTNYFKYLSSTDRRNMVCGYGADKNMTTITDLGYNCTLQYRYSSSGRRSVTCRCKKI